MRRREFITLLGGAAAAWPLAARAQQGERVRRIGVLIGLAADDPEGQARVGAFRRGCSNWVDKWPQHPRSSTRWAAANAATIRSNRGRIGRARAGRHLGHWQRGVGRVATGDPHRADRVRERPRSGRPGFVASLARPAATSPAFTIFEYSLSGKWLELLKENCAGHDASGRHSRSAITPGSASLPQSSLWRRRSAWR